jgi:hypothetical protein
MLVPTALKLKTAFSLYSDIHVVYNSHNRPVTSINMMSACVYVFLLPCSFMSYKYKFYEIVLLISVL